MDEFDRPGMVEAGLPEPYDRVVALLSDIDEQIEIFERSQVWPTAVIAVLADMRKRLAAAGLLTILAATSQ